MFLPCGEALIIVKGKCCQAYHKNYFLIFDIYNIYDVWFLIEYMKICYFQMILVL
jgi:hypothetical protein